MSSRKTDPVREMDRELELFRSELGQEFHKETQSLEVKRLERLERLEEITRETLKAVDAEWQGLEERVLCDAARQREMSVFRLKEMLEGLDGDALVSKVSQSALSRLLDEEGRKDAGP